MSRNYKKLRKEILDTMYSLNKDGYDTEIFSDNLEHIDEQVKQDNDYELAIHKLNELIKLINTFKDNVYLNKMIRDYYTFKYSDRDFEKIRNSLLDLLKKVDSNEVYYYLYLLVKEEMIRFGSSETFEYLSIVQKDNLIVEFNNSFDDEDIIIDGVDEDIIRFMVGYDLDQDSKNILKNGLDNDLKVIEGNINSDASEVNDLNEAIKSYNKDLWKCRGNFTKGILLGICYTTVVSTLLFGAHKLALNNAQEVVYKGNVQTYTEDGLEQNYSEYYSIDEAGTYVYKDGKKYDVTTLDGYTIDDYLSLDLDSLNIQSSKEEIQQLSWKIEIINLNLDDYMYTTDTDEYATNLTIYIILVLILCTVLEVACEIFLGEDHLLLVALYDYMKDILNEYKVSKKGYKFDKEKLKNIKSQVDNIYNKYKDLINSINDRLDILYNSDYNEYMDYTVRLERIKKNK